MSYVCYNFTLKKIECVDRETQSKYQDSILYESTNNGHVRCLFVDGKFYPCKYIPKDSIGRHAHYAIITRSDGQQPNGCGVSDFHETAVQILYEQILKKCYILFNSVDGYSCEFDAICQTQCGRRLLPAKTAMLLSKFKVEPLKTHSYLYPSRTPDILLRDEDSGCEIWIEINHSHDQTKDQNRLFLGVPIVEFDCFTLTDLVYLKYNFHKTHIPSKYHGQYENPHFRIFNPWNFPIYCGVDIPCNIYLKYHDLRPIVKKYKTVTNHYFILPDGRRIKGKIGYYGRYYPLNAEGCIISRRKLPDGFKEVDIKETIEIYCIDYDKIRRKKEKMGY